MAASMELGNETLDEQAMLMATFSATQTPMQISWTGEEQTTPEMPSFTITEWMDDSNTRINSDTFLAKPSSEHTSDTTPSRTLSRPDATQSPNLPIDRLDDEDNPRPSKENQRKPNHDMKLGTADSKRRRREQNRMSQRAYRQRKENYVQALERQLEDACSERDVLSSLCTTQGNLLRSLQSRIAELERDRAAVAAGFG